MGSYRVSLGRIVERANSVDQKVDTLMVGVAKGMAIHNRRHSDA